MPPLNDNASAVGGSVPERIKEQTLLSIEVVQHQKNWTFGARLDHVNHFGKLPLDLFDCLNRNLLHVSTLSTRLGWGKRETGDIQ